MYLIVGLGNIGDKYKNTRHNVGFDVVDLMAKKYNIDINRKKFKGVYGDGVIENQRVVLLKPSTYMNLSGESVREITNFYKISNENIIVIYDDISLEIGRLRIRDKGSAGGHNGIKNIILNLATDVFPRIKVGIGGPKHDLVSYVLGDFSKEESEKINKVFEVAAKATETMIKEGVSQAMNKYNGIKVE